MSYSSGQQPRPPYPPRPQQQHQQQQQQQSPYQQYRPPPGQQQYGPPQGYPPNQQYQRPPYPNQQFQPQQQQYMQRPPMMPLNHGQMPMNQGPMPMNHGQMPYQPPYVPQQNISQPPPPSQMGPQHHQGNPAALNVNAKSDGPELISPKPQRLMPSVPQDMAKNLQNKMDDEEKKATEASDQSPSFAADGLAALALSSPPPPQQAGPPMYPPANYERNKTPQPSQGQRQSGGFPDHQRQSYGAGSQPNSQPNSRPNSEIQPRHPSGPFLGPNMQPDRAPSPSYPPQNYAQRPPRMTPSPQPGYAPVQQPPRPTQSPQPPVPQQPNGANRLSGPNYGQLQQQSPQQQPRHSSQSAPQDLRRASAQNTMSPRNSAVSLPLPATGPRAPSPGVRTQSPAFDSGNHRPQLAHRSASIFDNDQAKLGGMRQSKMHTGDDAAQIQYAKSSLRAAERAPKSADGQRQANQWISEGTNIVESLAAKGMPEAIFIRGTWFEYGKFGRPVNKRDAFRAYEQAARADFAKGNFKVGKEFERMGDLKNAMQCFQRGVLLNDVASNYRVGMINLLGQHGQPQDFPRALSLIRRAADLADEDCPQPAYVFGMLLSHDFPQVKITDEILLKNEPEAKAYIEKAAELGFPPAQYKMGYCYEFSSLGCKFDPNLSVHWYTIAAQQGEAEADMSLSKWYLCGAEGCFKKDEALAFKYAESAAARGLASAEFAMGYFYEVGVHVSQNVEEARKWYEKAAAHGNGDAKSRIEGISRRKTLSRRDHETNMATTLQKRRTQAQKRSEARRPGKAGNTYSPARVSQGLPPQNQQAIANAVVATAANMGVPQTPAGAALAGRNPRRQGSGSELPPAQAIMPPVPTAPSPSQNPTAPKKGPQSFDQMVGIAEYTKNEECSIM